MSAPGSLTWFARHETRLAWREIFAMMTGGRQERTRSLVTGALIFLAVMHAVAYFAVAHLARAALEQDLPTLIGVTAAILLSGSAILSQAMESATRTFYTRSDLELILSSPARSQRLFAVRIGAIALSVSTLSLILIGPFINVLAWQGGAQWLGGYGVIFAVALTATAIAMILTAALFQTIGPRRTRLAAQIAAAVIGGAFVIGLQFAALFSTGMMSRLAFLQSDVVLAHAPALGSLFWLPAEAALGDVRALIVVIALSAAFFVAITAFYAPRFAAFAVAASGVSHASVGANAPARSFRVEPQSAALRRKERLLLLRDPWLLSQTLMQLLYLLPPAALLWHGYAGDNGAAIVLVPVLIMAAGQLGGGLAWLTISGEDAPDLVLTAPIAERRLLRAKVEAVMQCIAVVFAPFALALALLPLSPMASLIAVCGVTASAASATAIQFWFRAQAKRTHFRRRHTSSRIATLSEAFCSIGWAATGAIATTGSPAWIVVALLTLGILLGVRAASPARKAAR